MKVTYEEIIKRFKRLTDPKAIEGMARYGITPQKTFGVSIPNLRKIAKEAGRNRNLAQKLWASDNRETRILAGMIDEPPEATEEQMERAQGFVSGPFLYISSAVGGVVFVAILLLLFAFVLNLFIPVFGGTGAFKTVFSVVTHAGLVKVLSAIVKVILVAVTKSVYVTTSLALLAPNMDRGAFGYQLLSGCDFFIIWEMILVSIGINITNNVSKKNAYILVFLIWVVSLFVGALLGTLQGGRGV